MKQQDLATKIGINPRTIRKWSPYKRQQWEHLAMELGCEYDAEFFDLLGKLAFDVAAFNARRWKTDKAGAMLNISYTITFGVYGHDPSEPIIPAITLRKAADVAQAIKELEALKNDWSR